VSEIGFNEQTYLMRTAIIERHIDNTTPKVILMDIPFITIYMPKSFFGATRVATVKVSGLDSNPPKSTVYLEH